MSVLNLFIVLVLSWCVLASLNSYNSCCVTMIMCVLYTSLVILLLFVVQGTLLAAFEHQLPSVPVRVPTSS